MDLSLQNQILRPKIEAAIRRVLDRSIFVFGPEVEAFEGAFARFVGSRFAVGVGSGSDALRLALQALDLGQGDEVILPANTFIATALAVSSVGARPVLVDSHPTSFNIDVRRIEDVVTSRTRAIIAVHLAGQSADMTSLLETAKRHGLAVIEDAAQAHGASHKDRSCGSMGDLGCFSFYPSKNLGCYGDGGMVTTNDSRLASRLRRLRNYGQETKHEHLEIGWNSRLDTLQAAILSVKLEYLAEWNAARAELARSYVLGLDPIPGLSRQRREAPGTHVYHLFMVTSSDRDGLRQHLSQEGIRTAIHYPKPVHLQPAYLHLGYRQGDFPISERLSCELLSLPMYPELRQEQVHRVLRSIRSFMEKGGAPADRHRS